LIVHDHATTEVRAPHSGSATSAAWRSPVAILLLVTGAVCVRRGVDGWPGATSPAAGVLFAGLLLGVWLAARTLPAPQSGSWPALSLRLPTRSPRSALPVTVSIAAGLAGAALLCAGPLYFRLRDGGAGLPLDWFPGWAAVVTAVAVTEELVLRGTLWSTLAGRPVVALGVTTAAFAALHVPFYGLESVPVNLAAGLVLGGLRYATGSVLAPAVTHTVADLAGWFLL
jgi:membrane protease YdiL (CAAX protease family)